MLMPKDVGNLEMAFGGDMGKLLPSMKDIPAEFYMFGTAKECEIISEWFFEGLPKETKFIPKNGIDEKIALRHIIAILKSWEPKHEHKMAACAYLLNLWFEDIRFQEKKSNDITID